MFSPAADRNKGPIFEVLRPYLENTARLLELASGSLQHARYMAPKVPGLSWIPTDLDQNAVAHGRNLAVRPRNVAAPVLLDVHDPRWPVEDVDAVYAANLLHISPSSVAEALFAGSRRVLGRGGLVFLYGPFREGGRHTSPGNEAFDGSLKARNEAWGIRSLEDVSEAARLSGFALVQRTPMPANNLLLVFGAKGSQ
jgi:cyclopropane fatty-acyl-phospholipid synthase-like methyltransferase